MDREVSLEETISSAPERGADMLALDGALNAVERLDPRKFKAVELRYLGGLSMEETAQALAVYPGTIRRASRMAEAWLHREMRGG
jgi:DNA-directed RNA polymerase specialized sigma24 family protein